MLIHKLLFVLALFAFLYFIGSKVIEKPKPAAVTENKQLANSTPHAQFHYPIVDGKKIQPEPYLRLPFKKVDGAKAKIAEGWLYSKEELQITHIPPKHDGIDYALPYGTPVLAPADGFAIASYQTSTLLNKNGEVILYKDKPVNMGYGYFVRMYVPAVDRFVTIAHLSEIDVTIPFSPPEQSDGGWLDTNTKMPADLWMDTNITTFIKKGTVIGKVGYSGLTWGYEEYDWSGVPYVIDPAEYKSWDEPHIHLEEHWIDSETQEITAERDPYGIYSTFEDYPTQKNAVSLGKDPLFILNEDGTPKYADE